MLLHSILKHVLVSFSLPIGFTIAVFSIIRLLSTDPVSQLVGMTASKTA
jgi:ABC-type dipeptide/oligopeptide/nickel transport system permease component